jgi:hypothetical protein
MPEDVIMSMLAELLTELRRRREEKLGDSGARTMALIRYEWQRARGDGGATAASARSLQEVVALRTACPLLMARIVGRDSKRGDMEEVDKFVSMLGRQEGRVDLINKFGDRLDVSWEDMISFTTEIDMCESLKHGFGGYQDVAKNTELVNAVAPTEADGATDPNEWRKEHERLLLG